MFTKIFFTALNNDRKGPYLSLYTDPGKIRLGENRVSFASKNSLHQRNGLNPDIETHNEMSKRHVNANQNNGSLLQDEHKVISSSQKKFRGKIF